MEDDKKRQHSHEKNKSIPSFKDYMRQFPLGLPQEILNTMKKFPGLTGQFNEHLEMVKLYRPSLGNSLEGCWVDVMAFIKRLVGQINTIIKSVRDDCDSKLNNIVKTTTDLEAENKALKDKVERLQILRELESQDLNLADIETQTLKRQINSIYDIMQRDMKRILQYLVNVEKSQQSQTSSSIFIGLERLASSIKLLEEERDHTSSALGTMNELIKAMAKNTKTDSCTQVQQSELQWKAKDVFPVDKNKKVLIEEVERSSINLEANLDKNPEKQHIITQMQLKEKQFAPQIYNPKKNVQKPWVLPPTILVFLQNMSKDNENGRVLPWEHVKKTIYEIYQERIAYSRQLIGGMVGTATSFDEFFVLYFIKKHNIRRLAEIKMLELIISIKYYTKFWPKAQMFAYVLDIMRFQPSFEVNQTNNYKFDLHLQSFFFTVFGRLFDGEIVEWDDGATFASFSRIKNIMKRFLFFSDQLSRSRLFARLEKSVRIKEKKEYADFDYALQLIIDEYFACRKRNLSILSKAFSKTSQTIQGYFSLKQITNLFKELENIYSQGSGFGVKYPADSSLQLCKLYLYSITSGKNNFEVNGKEFLTACQRFGFDSPFPFIHICSAVDIVLKENSQELQLATTTDLSKTVKKNDSNDVQGIQEAQKQSAKLQPDQPQPATNLSSIAAKRVEIGSIIFSQHFSILRQLREYCVVFKETLSGEKDIEKAWANFQKILHILDKGCQFLRFPLKT